MTDLLGDVVEMPIRKTADISDCGTFRYRLTRYWGPGYALPFIMLNPSTADAEVDDPTIRRCMGFARRENAGGIVVANLLAYRATKPKDLLKVEPMDRVGPKNERALYEIMRLGIEGNMPIVCAWGSWGPANGVARGNFTVEFMKAQGARLVCLGKTADGHPRHPLYVKGDQPLIPFGT